MDFQSFAWWLHGYSEICGKVPDEKQWAIIQEHLNLCFNKVTKLSMKELTYCSNTTQFPNFVFGNVGKEPFPSGCGVGLAGSSPEARKGDCQFAPHLPSPTGDIPLTLSSVNYITC